jgi:tetratricopeptide (TPR) repeat protein
MKIRISRAATLCVGVAFLSVFSSFTLSLDALARRHHDAGALRMRELRRMVHAGRAQEAIYELESMTRKNPKDVEAWLLLSRVYIDMDETNNGNMMGKAIAAAKSALSVRPNNSTCLKALAELYARQGRFKEAIALLDKAVAQKNVDPFTYKAYALILSENKRDKEAARYWDKFAVAMPNAESSLRHLDCGALIYARAGETDKSVALYDKIYQMEPLDSWLMKKAEAYEMGGRNNLAIDLYSKIIKGQADDELALSARAKLYSKIGKNKEALADMNAAIKELPTSKLYLQRAGIYEKMGNAAMAKKDRERANSQN